jgi:hypothetical protein
VVGQRTDGPVFGLLVLYGREKIQSTGAELR